MTADMFCLGTDPVDTSRMFMLPYPRGGPHALVIGGSGTGKSYFFADQIGQDVISGRAAVIVIDPKGDLVRDVLAGLAMAPEQSWPALARDVIVVDPSDAQSGVAFNPFEVPTYTTPARVRQDVVTTMRTIFGFDDTRTARMVLVLRRSVQLATEQGLTMCDLPRLLTDQEYRSKLVARTEDGDLRRFWQHEFPTTGAQQHQWTSSTLVRLETLLDDPAVRRLLGQPNSTFNFREVMDAGKVCLISLAKGRIGQETSRLLGGFLMSRLQLAAESRASLPDQERTMCHAYIDEHQNYASSEAFEDMLNEARGYGLSLHLAHQHFAQLPDTLRQALLTNAYIRVAFRLSTDDAAIIAREFFLITGQRVKRSWWTATSLGRIPIPYKEYQFFSPGEEARQNREALHYLADRQMFAHIAGEYSPYLLRTNDFPVSELASNRARIEGFREYLRAEAQSLRQPSREVLPPATVSEQARRRFEWQRDTASQPAQR